MSADRPVRSKMKLTWKKFSSPPVLHLLQNSLLLWELHFDTWTDNIVILC